MEIPPRVRRRDATAIDGTATGGNTSACAEKSPVVARQRRQEWKYLRVRGEESTRASPNHAVPEIPTRARRRDEMGFVVRCWRRKYLRVRGEE